MVDKPTKPSRSPAEARQDRLAAALRENLRRRKTARAEAADAGPVSPDEQGGNTQPASKPED